MSNPQPKLSILISSFNRVNLFRRCLFSIAYNRPSIPFEVIVVDDGSTEDVLGLLNKFSSSFPWKFIRFNMDEFTKKTGIKKFHNNPAASNNIAFKHASGDLIALMGNEVIAFKNCFDQMLDDVPTDGSAFNVFSTTYDVPQQVLDVIDSYGQHLDQVLVDTHCKPFPLQDESYRSDVTNYLSISSRKTWYITGGYDERYLGGIACEDSDFVRRCRAIKSNEYKHILSKGVSLHQYHGGMTRYYNPKVIDMVKWNEGLSVNRAIYNSWDGGAHNPQAWEPGTTGVGEIITNAI